MFIKYLLPIKITNFFRNSEDTLYHEPQQKNQHGGTRATGIFFLQVRFPLPRAVIHFLELRIPNLHGQIMRQNNFLGVIFTGGRYRVQPIYVHVHFDFYFFMSGSGLEGGRKEEGSRKEEGGRREEGRGRRKEK
jgi:hypothetical protein